MVPRATAAAVVFFAAVVLVGLVIVAVLVVAAADAREGADCASSRTTSVAFLSVRSPWNDGWRSAPSLLHSVNAISATRSGLTQCAPLASKPRGGFTNGGCFCSRLTRT